MFTGTSAAMLVGTCWKKFLNAFPLPLALLGPEILFLFYVLLEVDAGTSAAMLVGTFAPEIRFKSRLHLRWLARVRHACWYVRSNACWYVLKNFLSAFPLPSALLGTENFFPFYVLPVRPQQCLFGKKNSKCWKKILSVGKKFLSAFPMPLALLGTENFFRSMFFNT